jgi:AP-1 complex subunit gamma-1
MILARFQVSGGVAATGLSFQAAVPKVNKYTSVTKKKNKVVDISAFFSQSQQLQMLPMSNPNINPGAVETQQMRVVAPVGVSYLPSPPFDIEN